MGYRARTSPAVHSVEIPAIAGIRRETIDHLPRIEKLVSPIITVMFEQEKTGALQLRGNEKMPFADQLFGFGVDIDTGPVRREVMDSQRFPNATGGKQLPPYLKGVMPLLAIERRQNLGHLACRTVRIQIGAERKTHRPSS